MTYGPATHHLMKAREYLNDLDPNDPLVELAQLHLDSTLLYVRRLAHRRY